MCRNHEHPSPLLGALEHAYRRLNEIPHRYADTDFKRIQAAIASARKPLRLLIVLDGGLVRSVYAEHAGIEAVVIDQDTEGADESEITLLTNKDHTLEGCLTPVTATAAPEWVEAAFKALNPSE